ncbi:MAG: delta-60 repeat domain-containing protein, partial [Sphingobacteriia bacterium]
TARNRITRLNADGSLDVNFNPTGSGANDEISAVIVQSDGKVLIGGRFTSYNGTARNRIARLNSDGSLDVNFNPIGSGANDEISALALQAGGKVVIGGEFTSYNGTSRSRIARLNADGSLDTGFNPGTGPDDAVFALALQPDGKVLIGGALTSFSGVTRNKIARLNVDGSLDTGFAPDTGANEDILSLILLSDGKVLIGGVFWAYDGISRNGVARLNANGSLDNAVFTPTGTGLNDQINALALQPDGPVVKVLIGGDFTTHNESGRNRIARLNPNGSMDAGFNPVIGADREISTLYAQPDGKVLIGGWFSSYNGTSRKNIARLNADGSLDASFNSTGTGADGDIYTIVVQPDGKVLIGGWFSSYNGTSRKNIARLNADGNLDASFNPGAGANSQVFSIALQPDGKMLIEGGFSSYNNTPRNRIARLNADGSLDTGFNPGSSLNGAVSALAPQPDGKVLIGGNFTSYSGTPRNRIARLNADGSLDTSFDPGTGTNNEVSEIILQPDGKMFIAGIFTSYNGTFRNRLARLNIDGSLDTSFNPGVATDDFVLELVVQHDGKVLIGGRLTSYNGTARKNIARLSSDGTLDESFNPGVGMNGLVRALVLQPDGKVLIGGDFTSYNGSPRAYVARVLG